MNKLAKISKKIYKAILYFLLIVTKILIICYILINSSYFQNYIIDKLTSNLSAKFNTTVSIDYISIELINKIVLEGLYIEDLSGDTMLFVNEFKLALNDINFKNHEIYLDKIIFEETVASLQSDTAGTFNFQFIIDAFPTDTTDTSSTNWKIDCHNFELINSKLSIQTGITDSTDIYTIDFKNMVYNNLNLAINDVYYNPEKLSFNIKNLNIIEKSGFILNNFQASCYMDSNLMSLQNVIIHTKHSKINCPSISLNFKNLSEDFNNFTNKVKIESEFISSQVGLADLQYFDPYLKGLDQNIFISGLIKGKISRLKGKNIKLIYGKETSFNGNISIDGLPDLNNTFIHADINELKTSITDINNLPQYPFDQKKSLSFPAQLFHFGNIRYNGKITGFLSDFVAYGNFQTSLGNINTDISIKQDNILKRIAFAGQLNTTDFNIGKLSEQTDLIGLLSFNASVNGHRSNVNSNIYAELDGNIIKVDLLDYIYQNVKVEGILDNKKFDGSLNLNDPNIKMDFLGRFDLNEDIPIFDFTADLSDVNLYKLHLDTLDSMSNISLLITAKFEGNEIDNIQGAIDLFNVHYNNKRGGINIDQMLIKSTYKDSIRDISIRSDLLDLDINGKYDITSLSGSAKKFCDTYFPAFNYIFKGIDNNSAHNEFDYEIHVKKTGQLVKTFASNLDISDSISIYGNFNSKQDLLSLKLKAKHAQINNIKLSKILLDLSSKDSSLITKLYLNRLNLNESSYIQNIVAHNSLKNNIISSFLSWQNTDSVEYSGELISNVNFIKRENTFPKINILFSPSLLVMADRYWYLNDCELNIDTTKITVNKLTFNNNEQYFYANGAISDQPEDTLKVIINELSLDHANQFTKPMGLIFEGVLSGEAKVSNLFTNAVAVSNFNIQNFKLNDQELGVMIIKSGWENKSKKINVNAVSKRGNIKTIEIKGDYLTENSLLDFTIDIDRFRMNIFEPFLEGFISKIRGLVQGNFALNGTINKPNLNGNLILQKSSFTVDYLQTRYNFTDSIKITNTAINFASIKINDSHGNYALANGSISHDFFKDFKLNIALEANKFQFMNTKPTDNELFYGEAYGSGMINITGSPNNIHILVNAKTEKIVDNIHKLTRFTNIRVPLGGSEDIAENDFIKFVNEVADTSSEEKYNVDLSGIQLDFDFEVTPDAEIQIIFDSKVGDIIRAKGNANLKLEINTLGNFNMYGEYNIEEGDYLFTLQNVINKKFNVEKGGYIKWNGDPYSGYMDISAIYRLKSSLYDLTQDTSQTKRVPVECRLHMTEDLLSPNIQFDIEVPTASEEAKSIISRLSEDEVNKQILSLLVLNRFYTPPSHGGTGVNQDQKSGSGTGAVGVTSSELLSNQLSHWLSQISNDFDIGVNYRPGDELTSDELEVALSTQILNDRVSINGNVGMSGQNENTNNIVGDVVVDVKIDKNGKFRFKGFNKSNDNLIYEESPYTQGVGLFYREDFDNWGDLMRKYWIFKKKEKEKAADTDKE